MPTFTTPNPIRAHVEVPLGDVHLTADDRTTTVVEVQPSNPANDEDVRGAELTQVEYTDGLLRVLGPKRTGTVMRSWLSRSWGGSIDVMIRLPAGSDLEATLGAADLQADGRLGDTRIKTGLGRVRLEATGALDVDSGAGEVSIDHVGGHATVKAGSGEVRIGELADTAVVRNSNGATWIGAARDHLRVKAANGSVDIEHVEGDTVAKSANGSIRVRDVLRGSVVLETSMGNIEIGIPEGTAAWIDANTTAGTIRNELDEATKPGEATEKAQVRARTSVGQILIRRSHPAEA
ncbi:MAG TPA: DUF4097 family beta strand repeat-containing protein [Nitriliruptorales bacterium]